MAYWISPWLGVLMANRLYDRVVSERTFTDRHFRNPAGVLAMGFALIVSVLLFSSQSLYVGVVPSAFPEIGDVTFIAGFASAFGSYIVLRRFISPRISTQHPTDRTNRKAPNS
jgi:NCS1 family nucleobase:cation symporter-1